MNKKRRRSAAEIQADPEIQRHIAERDLRRRRRDEAAAQLDRPVMADLQARGFYSTSVHEAVKAYEPLPPEFVEVLLDWVGRLPARDTGTPPRCSINFLEMLVRYLSVAQQPFDGRVLAECFDATNDPSLQWAIVNTIAAVKPYGIDDWMQKLVQNPYLKKTYQNLSG